ncbi:glycosyltransferase family 4 protein [Photobacterium damselae]|uniref:glycosyltransferase family 4 protein n=1 Tax=Photobacterium damselae TaxID=38293 RepID=UPI002542C83E
MKFAIDIRWMVGNFRGMGRYAWQFINPIKDVTIALGAKNTIDSNLPNLKKGNSFFPYWEQYILPFLSKQSGAEYLICPYNTGPLYLNKDVKLILVIHDLIFLRDFKELPLSISIYQSLGRLYRRFIVPKVIQKADVIISVSEYTKKEIQEKYPDIKNIHVIPNAISEKWINQKIIDINLREDFFFTVAGEAPSKNVINLIRAFDLYKKKSNNKTKLKIAGIKPSNHKSFINLCNELNLSDSIEFLDYISNYELMSLYSSSRGFIFASLFEGFGIPLIEALSSGVPIACSNTTSMPEVVGNCAFKFDPKNIIQISDGFEYFDSSHDVLSSNISLGLERAKSYSETVVNEKIKLFWLGFNNE